MNASPPAGGFDNLQPGPALDSLLQEFRALQAEIREINRSTTQAMVLALSVITLGAAFAGDKNPQIALLLAPLLLGAVATYQLNTSAGSAALAEYRDRLALRLNEALQYPVYNERRVQNRLRGSLGTLGAYGVAATVCFGAMGLGLHQNLDEKAPLPLLQLVVTAISLTAMLLGLWDFLRTRGDVNQALDQIGLARWRPAEQAQPATRQRWLTWLIRAVRGSDAP